MQHHRVETPAYEIWVEATPSNNGKGKIAYLKALREAAARVVASPILSRDIELEVVYATAKPRGARMDVDNVNKSTLDALKGIVYGDDAQVRSVKTTILERGTPATLSTRVEHVGRILEAGDKDIVLVEVYSDQRLAALGGAQKVGAGRVAEWLSRDVPTSEQPA